MPPSGILWKSLRLGFQRRIICMECLSASLTLNISAWFSKLLNTFELELQMLNSPEKNRNWQGFLPCFSTCHHWKHSPFTKLFWLLTDVTHTANGSPHNPSAVGLNSVSDVSHTRCQCSLFSLTAPLPHFLTAQSLNNIITHYCRKFHASPLSVFNRAEVLL